MSIRISQGLDLRQSQSLVMTPQLQQAIKLLQMSNLELSEYLEGELAQNPLLERVEGDGEGEGDAPEDAGASERDDAARDEDRPDAPEGFDSPDTEYDVGVERAGSGGRSDFDESDEGFEATLTRPETLRDHLMDQLALDIDDETDRRIGALLIDHLDEAGYLRHDPDELAQRIGCPPERMSRVLARLKTFDPAGLFARDLAECLFLQLEDRGQLDYPMRILLQHLDLLAARDLGKLSHLCSVDSEDLAEMIAQIRACDPKPAARFEHVVAQTLIPDVLMKRLPREVGGGWRVELNAQTLPRVLINRSYFQDVAQRASSESDKSYLSQQMASANWLVRALDQRAQTILKVAGEIVEQQDAFFLYGIEFLRPLTLKDIAERIDMHESTVSRVTTNKYIATPRGLFELKFFFSTAIGGTDGAQHSAEAVKARIKSLIDAEAPDAVLSDDALVELLRQGGIDIARRTVAKYREGMNIPSSVERRKRKG